MAWYNSNWDYRVAIESQNAKVDEAVTNSYVDLSELPAGFWANVKNGGGDIRVTQSDGITEVAREIVFCDTGTDTGEVHFDCTGIQTGSDVTWYIYYGNAAASDYAVDAEFGAENVWDTNYKAVLHCQDVTSLLDSTDNSNDATNHGAEDGTGLIGTGTDFTPNDYIDMPDSDDWSGAGSVTISFYINAHSADGKGVFEHRTDNTNSHYCFLSGGDKFLYWAHLDGGGVDWEVQSDGAFPEGSLVRVDLVNDQDANTQKMYINKVLQADTGAYNGAMDDWTSVFYLGYVPRHAQRSDMVLDEYRYQKGVARSDNWRSTMHNNQSDSATFWGIGAEESAAVIGPIQSGRSIGAD